MLVCLPKQKNYYQINYLVYSVYPYHDWLLFIRLTISYRELQLYVNMSEDKLQMETLWNEMHYFFWQAMVVIINWDFN